MGVDAYMVDNAGQIDPAWLSGKKKVGVTAGASAPDVLVREVIERFRELGADRVAEMAGKHEGVVFTLPKSLLAPPVDR
jgi:4-hydroxy-3-methylbut-2-enyl diphosphate reductase